MFTSSLGLRSAGLQYPLAGPQQQARTLFHLGHEAVAAYVNGTSNNEVPQVLPETPQAAIVTPQQPKVDGYTADEFLGLLQSGQITGKPMNRAQAEMVARHLLGKSGNEPIGQVSVARLKAACERFDELDPNSEAYKNLSTWISRDQLRHVYLSAELYSCSSGDSKDFGARTMNQAQFLSSEAVQNLYPGQDLKAVWEKLTGRNAAKDPDATVTLEEIRSNACCHRLDQMMNTYEARTRAKDQYDAVITYNYSPYEGNLFRGPSAVRDIPEGKLFLRKNTAGGYDAYLESTNPSNRGEKAQKIFIGTFSSVAEAEKAGMHQLTGGHSALARDFDVHARILAPEVGDRGQTTYKIRTSRAANQKTWQMRLNFLQYFTRLFASLYGVRM